MTEDVDAISQRDLDYQSRTTTVHFQPNEKVRTVTINIEDDRIKEDTEVFKVKMQKVESSLLDVCTQETQVQIIDDDGMHDLYMK